MQMQFKSIWKTGKNEEISVAYVIEALSLVVIGTKKGAIHFFKYRSGFSLKTYPGKDDNSEVQVEAAAPGKQGRSPAKSSPSMKGKTKAVSIEEPVASEETSEKQSDLKDVPFQAQLVGNLSLSLNLQ